MFNEGDLIVNKKTGTLYKITHYSVGDSIFFSLKIQQVKAPFHKYYPHPHGLSTQYESLEAWTSRRLLNDRKVRTTRRKKRSIPAG